MFFVLGIALATYRQLALENLRRPHHNLPTYSKDCVTERNSLIYKTAMAAQQKDPEVIALAKTFNHTPTGDEYEKMISGML